MTLLACIPVTGCSTLAEVAACSLSAVDNTYPLDTAVNVVFEDDGGNDILTIYEANRGVQAHAHAAIGAQAAIDDAALYFGVSTKNTLTIEERFDSMATDFVMGALIAVELNPAVDAVFAAGNGILVSVQTTDGNDKDIYFVAGVQGAAYHNGTGTIGSLEGMEFSATNIGDGDITRATGILIYQVTNVATGSVGESRGLWITDGFDGGGGIGLMIGLHIEDQTAGSSNFAIQTNAGHVVINEGSDDDTDFRVEGASNTHLLFTDGSADRVGINDSTPDGKLDIVQSSTTGAIPVVEVEQLDVSEEFFNFVGTVATGNPIEAIGSKTFTATHLLRCAVNGSFGYVLFGTAA